MRQLLDGQVSAVGINEIDLIDVFRDRLPIGLIVSIGLFGLLGNLRSPLPCSSTRHLTSWIVYLHMLKS